jgi:hypothetical protein
VGEIIIRQGQARGDIPRAYSPDVFIAEQEGKAVRRAGSPSQLTAIVATQPDVGSSVDLGGIDVIKLAILSEEDAVEPEASTIEELHLAAPTFQPRSSLLHNVAPRAAPNPADVPLVGPEKLFIQSDHLTARRAKRPKMFHRPHFLSPWRQFLGALSRIASAPALLALRMRRQTDRDVQRQPPAVRSDPRAEDAPLCTTDVQLPVDLGARADPPTLDPLGPVRTGVEPERAPPGRNPR